MNDLKLLYATETQLDLAGLAEFITFDSNMKMNDRLQK